ncbi:MAG: dihydrodipicolinate synthase family protein [Casimicrobiaceae bacterium]
MDTYAAVRGLWCATLTPIDSRGNADIARLAAHVRDLFAQGVAGVAPFGTTGEFPSFSASERMHGLEALLAAGIPAARVVPGTGAAALPDAVALTRHAVRSGTPRCLIVPPFFFKDVGDDAVYSYYARLIDTVAEPALRVYLYHIPQFSGVPVRPDVVARLAKAYPAVIAGVKDSSGDYQNTQALLARAPHLSILVGHEPHVPQLLRDGGAGTICGVSNVFPAMIAALLNPAVSAADEARVAAFLKLLFSYPFLAAFKAIRAAQTGDPGWNALRAPWMPLDDARRAKLLAELASAGLLAPAETTT